MNRKTKKWIIALGVLLLLFVLYGSWRVRVPVIDAEEITSVYFVFNPVDVTSRKNCMVYDRETVLRLCDHVNQMEKDGFAWNRPIKGGGWESVYLRFDKGDVIRWTVSISGGDIIEYHGAVLTKTFHLGEGEVKELQRILTELWEANPDSTADSHIAQMLRELPAKLWEGDGAAP